ncbi:DUF11 domain-containing protein [Pedobacter endophyticus]|uniref:DUF11 domain-containing protein n=1 Tax=Pedobacter endophyticus TaxID=2789740 RepID=A0A7S9L0Q7_9SPHI|nr:DUF11 domain-containing protein [Pedobacter endophyticus]QPH40144.1 DUF11 domain-containing protein [Pedobacter endophyticus]
MTNLATTRLWSVNLLIVLICSLLGNKAFAQATIKVPFSQRISAMAPGDFKNKQTYSLQGDFTMLGNSNAFVDPYSDDENNSSAMKFYKLPADANNPAIRNSSAADFKLPAGLNSSCTKIVFAGLYWAGRGDNNSADVLSKSGNAGDGMNKKKIKFKAPGMASYTDITATDLFYGSSDVSGMYTGYYDVTNLVRNAGVGTYSVANIATFEGEDNLSNPVIGYYGGWGLVIVYENTSLKWRDITVFDGFAHIKNANGGAYGQLDVAGFRACQNGSVHIRMGMMAGEGDRDLAGDYFQIQMRNSSAYQSLSHGGNTAGNFFNSSVYTGGNTRMPNRTNNYGIDISMFDLPNTNNSLISNNQTSTSFRFGTTQDVYNIFNITFAVDAYVPQVELLNVSKSGVANQGDVAPGQVLDFDLNVYNKGTEAIKNGKVEVVIPPNLHFVKATSALGGGTVTWTHPYSTDPAATPGGKIVWDLGTIPLPADPSAIVATLKYKLKVTDDCTLLTTSNSNCELSVELNGNIAGQGAISNSNVRGSFIIGYNDGACMGNPIREPFTMNIKVGGTQLKNCPRETANGVRQFAAFCSATGNVIPRLQIASAYPAGTKFYAQVPGTTGYTSSLVTGDFAVAANGTSTKYYAVLEGAQDNCYLKLETLIDKVTTQPTAQDINYCFGSTAPLNNQLSATGSANGYQLFYFADASTPTPLSAAPAPTAAGTYTYYVAEGILRDNVLCIGSKVPFIITVNAVPVITQNIDDFYVCNKGNKTVSVQATNGASVEWQYYNKSAKGWTPITNSTFSGTISPGGNNLNITGASIDIDALKIRAMFTSAGGCVAYTNEAIIQVKNCMIMTNPMIPAKFKKN